jgi:phosphotransferase system  glucose/maltose/N-acetylglucosamine-specific IIC component
MAVRILMIVLETLADVFFVLTIVLLLSGYWQSSIVMFLTAVYFAIANFATHKKEEKKHGNSSR